MVAYLIEEEASNDILEVSLLNRVIHNALGGMWHNLSELLTFLLSLIRLQLVWKGGIHDFIWIIIQFCARPNLYHSIVSDENN